MKKLAPVLMLASLVGCANVQLQDAKTVSFDATRYSDRIGLSPIPAKAVNIRSTATPMTKSECPDDKCLSQGVRLPIQTPLAIDEQLTSDLRSYFDSSLRLDSTSDRTINVTIYKAQAYKSRRVPAAGWIPIVGLVVPDEFKIGLQLGLTISIYESEQLIKNYQFDRELELTDPINSDSKDIYSRVLEESRRVLYSEIDHEVISHIARPRTTGVVQLKTLTEELQQLVTLKNSGALTENEFAQAKASLLAREAKK